ncbi:MAG: flagellar motor stator protein MotA [Alphaproteobacteria bacterium]|nr:flagellar motor stator protein MotA [Alphaproteobacteria bacterium]
MLTIGGFAVVLICVFGGYILAGGKIGIILQALPFEMMIIGGSAAGTFLMANSGHGVKHALHDLGKAFKGARFHKHDYVELLSLLFFFVKLAATKGAMALEAHIEKPEESAAFKAFPKILADPLARALICDYLRMVGMHADDPHQIEDVFARELRKTQAENQHVAHALQLVADGLPALGIVAAVMGVIKTMGSITEPPPVLGKMIGSALVGTFLGVLLAYGMVGPIAARLKGVYEEEARYYEVIQSVLVAHLHGNAPQVSVETGRKIVPSEHMPGFAELEQALQELKIG